MSVLSLSCVGIIAENGRTQGLTYSHHTPIIRILKQWMVNEGIMAGAPGGRFFLLTADYTIVLPNMIKMPYRNLNNLTFVTKLYIMCIRVSCVIKCLSVYSYLLFS